MNKDKIENINQLNLTNEDNQLIKNYQDKFNQIYKMLQETRDERLQFKKLQVQTIMTDILLQSKDNQDGVYTTKHTLNIEV